MRATLDKICQEIAGRVLEVQRGLNTPERRLELADVIRATIETYLSFERQKNKPKVRTPK
jgi:hypothetical protein